FPYTTLFRSLRILVSIGCGVAEPIGVSNTAEWWPKEHRGFAIGAHHAGYPVGAMLSGVVMASIIYYFGPENWRYAFYLGIIISVRSEEHTSELQSRENLVCRLLL